MPNYESSAHSRLFSTVLFTFFLGAPLATAQAQEALDIYFIDVEGGGATLFVSPTGESLLIEETVDRMPREMPVASWTRCGTRTFLPSTT